MKNALGAGFLRLALAAGALLAAPAVGAAASEDRVLRIVAVGDSLVAGFGLESGDGFVPQLQEWLDRRAADAEIANAGVSGDTTAGGLARLDWSIGEDADGVFLALGANDMLRGMDPVETRANLAAMLNRLREKDVPVLLAGMRACANLGPEYQESFDSIYPALAEEYGVQFYPFLREGIAMEPLLNQQDGIHPNARGVVLMVEAIGPYVLSLVESIRADE